MAGAAVLLVGAIGFASGPAAGQASAVASWPTWGFNTARTRVGPNVGLPNQRQRLWYASELVGGFGDLIEYPPSISGGRLFYCTNGGGQGGQVVARDLKTGAQLWRYLVAGGGQFASEPTVSDGIVYVGSMGPHEGRGSKRYKPELLALQAADGGLLARNVIGRAVESSPLIVGNRLYVCSQNGRLFCFDKRPTSHRQLRLLWSRPLGAKATSSPAYRYGRVVVATYGGTVLAFNDTSGELLWRRQLRGQFYGTPAIAGSRVVVASKSNGFLYCLSLVSGRTLWSYDTRQGLYASPAVWNNTVYVGSKMRCLWAFDVRTGSPKWPANTVRSRRYAGAIYGSATVLKGVVYFSSLPAPGAKLAKGRENGRTYAVDGRTGGTRWTWPAGAYAGVTATSTVILVIGHHTIWAFRPRA
jgi:outer membrane protein assembly factor BamB